MRIFIAATLQMAGVLAFMAGAIASACVKLQPEKWATWMVKHGQRSDWLVYPPLQLLLGVTGMAFMVALIAGAVRDRTAKAARTAGVTSHGSARLATTAEVRAQGNGTKGVVLCMEDSARMKQKMANGKPYWEITKRAPLICTPVYNVLLEGPPGVGKSEAVILASLLTDTRRGDKGVSCVVLDPKGALWDKSSGFRAAFNDVYRFAPTQPDSAVCNPLLSIDPNAPRALLEADRMSHLLLMALKDEKDNSAFYAENAQPLLTGALLHALHQHKGTAQSIPGAFDLLFSPPPPPDPKAPKIPPLVAKVWQIHAGLPNRYGRLRDALDSLASDAKTLPTAFGTCRNALKFCKDDLTCAAISGQPGQRGYFTARDLSHGANPISVYFVIPFRDADLLTALTRLMLNQFLLSHDFGAKHETVYMLDEVPSIGPVPALAKAINQAREYGVQIVLSVQSKAQVIAVYGKDAGQAIIDGCRARVFMGLAGEEALKNLTEIIGKTTILTERETHAVSVKSLLERTNTTTNGVGANAREFRTADELRVDNGVVYVQLPGCHIYAGKPALRYAIKELNRRSQTPAPTRSVA